LSGRRTAIIGRDSVDEQTYPLYKYINQSSRPIAQAEQGAQVALEKCLKEFCKIKAQGIEGWIMRKNLWGIYAHEIIN
jgi:SH3-like domain-containing protein